MAAGTGPQEHAGRASQTFDVFLSYNRADQSAVEEIANALTRSGLAPWLDRWHLPAGTSWQRALGEALAVCRSCAVFVGAADLGDWEHQEVEVALDRAAKEPGFRVFLVLLPGVPDPFDAGALSPFLSTRTWVDLRGGIHAPDALRQLENAVKGIPPAVRESAAEPLPVCPYRGLETFDEEHAEFFFGREAVVQRALEKLKGARFLAVVGASGSGKSSLVRAGVIPALRAGRLEGSSAWQIRVMVPGAQPLTTLAAHLTRLNANGGIVRTLDELGRDQRTLHLAGAALLVDRPASERIVWVVDQGEEIFTLCRDERERSQFLANLLYAASAPDGRTSVIVTLRADFYARLAAYPEIAQAVASHQFLVGPMDRDDLRRVIEEPARRAGLAIDPGLVDTILDDVAHSPGALPLLEHALLELWNRGGGRRLTFEDYRASGGVDGALSQAADDLYASFSPAQQDIARRTLLRLTQPGEGTEDTRRRAALDELAGTGAELDVDTVVSALIQARLLTTSSEPETGERWLDVSHEALIRGWPRLRAWIDEDRAGLRIHRRVTEAVAEWESLDHDPGALFRGARLLDAEEYAARPGADLNAEERAFIAASTAARRRARRRRLALVAAAGGLAVAIAAAAVALSVVFRHQRDAAKRAESRAQSRELAAASESVRSSDLMLGMLLAIEANRRAQTDEARGALARALVADHELLTLRDPTEILTATYSADGRRIATFDDNGRVTVWDASSGRRISSLETGMNGLNGMVFQPGGRRLVIVGVRHFATLWDADHGKRIGRLPGGPRHRAIDVSDDGTLLLVRNGPSAAAPAAVWDALRDEQLAVVPGSFDQGVTFLPDGRTLIDWSRHAVNRVDWRRRVVTARLAHNGSRGWAVSPNGRYVVLDSGAIWDMQTGGRVLTLKRPREIGFARDSQFVLVAYDNRDVKLISLANGRSVRPPNAGVPMESGATAFDPRGRLYLDGFVPTGTPVIDTSTGQRLVSYDTSSGIPDDTRFSPDGRQILILDGSVARVEAAPATTADVLVPRHGPVDRVVLAGSEHAVTALTSTTTGEVRATSARLDTSGVPVEESTWRSHALRAVGLTHDGARVVVVGNDSTASVRIPPAWRATPKVSLTGATPVGERGAGLAGRAFLSDDGRRLVTEVAGGRPGIWDIGTGKPAILGPQGSGEPLALSRDGTVIVTASGGRSTPNYRSTSLIDGRSGKAIAALAPPVSTLRSIAFRSSDEAFAMGHADGVTRLWSRRGERLGRFDAPGRNPNGPLALSPGGGYLASVDDGLQIWRVADRAPIATLAPDVSGFIWIIWLGSRVAVLDYDGVLRTFTCDVCRSTAGLIKLAQSRVTRQLTPAETKTYLHQG